MSFTLFRREVVRPQFPKDAGLLSARVYDESKHSDRLGLAKALFDAWLFGDKPEIAKQCFLQSLFYAMKELGADNALNLMKSYLVEWQQKVRLAPLYCFAGSRFTLTLGDITIMSLGRGALFVIDLDSTKPANPIGSSEVIAVCTDINDKIERCLRELSKIKTALDAATREVSAVAAASAEVSASDTSPRTPGVSAG